MFAIPAEALTPSPKANAARESVVVAEGSGFQHDRAPVHLRAELAGRPAASVHDHLERIP